MKMRPSKVDWTHCGALSLRRAQAAGLGPGPPAPTHPLRRATGSDRPWRRPSRPPPPPPGHPPQAMCTDRDPRAVALRSFPLHRRAPRRGARPSLTPPPMSRRNRLEPSLAPAGDRVPGSLPLALVHASPCDKGRPARSEAAASPPEDLRHGWTPASPSSASPFLSAPSTEAERLDYGFALFRASGAHDCCAHRILLRQTRGHGIVRQSTATRDRAGAEL